MAMAKQDPAVARIDTMETTRREIIETPSSAAKPSSAARAQAQQGFTALRSRAARDCPFAWKALSFFQLSVEGSEVSLRPLAEPRQPPTAEKHGDPGGEQPRVRTHRSRGEQIDEQKPHSEQLSTAADVIERAQQHSYMRSKFFSISRRVSRSMTGRPCGQTVEYAVARSSSRMCVIFS